MALEYRNMDETKAFAKLKGCQSRTLKESDKERMAQYKVALSNGLNYYYGAKTVSDESIDALQDLADEQQLIEKYKSLLSGEFINTGENRMVLHQLCRGQQNSEVLHEGENKREFYTEQQKRFSDFAVKVHNGEITGSTGKQFKTVVQIGIGGSDLGPRALYLALKNVCSNKMDAHFISNVDPDDANAVLATLDMETTLFILVSKSGTTQETLANRNFVYKNLEEKNIPGFIPSDHFVAVTSKTSPLASSKDVLDAFFIDDFIGGRYSSTSAVGGVILSLAFGPEVFQAILDGAADADKAALNPDIRKNAALLDALLGVYERNVLGYPSTAILPYSQALSRFPAHLQQLDMESNGKSVNRRGEPVDYSTGPVIFGEPGTNGQHSFYQLLHQGTDIIPLQFIGFKKSQIDNDVEFEGSGSQKKLNANLTAQIIAFALGSKNDNPNKNFSGGRPASLILGEQLTPENLGALLAHFENKVMFQGFCWNLNSFDQEGVQLGKILTGQILKGEGMNDAMKALVDIVL